MAASAGLVLVAAMVVAVVDVTAAIILVAAVIVGSVILAQGRLTSRAIVRLSRDAKRERLAHRRMDRARADRARSRELRTRAFVDRRGRLLFAQLEALAWLMRELPLVRPLRPTRGWAASPDLLLTLVDLIDERRPASVLELGSGVSTVVMAARLKAVETGRLVSLEHDEGYAEETRRELVRQGLETVATVVHAPLGETRISTGTWRWYVPPEGSLPTTIDLLFVDGPPAPTGPLARYPALPLLAARLSPGAVVVLDDVIRDAEKQTARRWHDETPGSTLTMLELESGAAVLTLPNDPSTDGIASVQDPP